MPALSETQTPLFKRDQENGLLPPQHPTESTETYHRRLAGTYGLMYADVVRLLTA